MKHLLVANHAELLLYGCKRMPQPAVVFLQALPAHLTVAPLSSQSQLRPLLKKSKALGPCHSLVLTIFRLASFLVCHTVARLRHCQAGARTPVRS